VLQRLVRYEPHAADLLANVLVDNRFSSLAKPHMTKN
jgi:hypothetical protein